MAKFYKFRGIALVGMALLTGNFFGCTKKPSNEEIGKLDEAKAAAESAERKLSDLRMERIKLEQELGEITTDEKKENEELEEARSDEQ